MSIRDNQKKERKRENISSDIRDSAFVDVDSDELALMQLYYAVVDPHRATCTRWLLLLPYPASIKAKTLQFRRQNAWKSTSGARPTHAPAYP